MLSDGGPRVGIAALTLTVVTGLLTVPGGGGAYLDGAPAAHTGGFGEPTCHSCHLGSSIDDPDGSLEISAPESFLPGEEYPLVVRVRHPRLERGGFQLSARFLRGLDAGRQAGVLIPGPGTEIVEEEGIRYARHTPDGADPSAEREMKWRLVWRAPAEARSPVVFHVAANAANHDDSELGDLVYRGEAEVRPDPAR